MALRTMAGELEIVAERLDALDPTAIEVPELQRRLEATVAAVIALHTAGGELAAGDRPARAVVTVVPLSNP